MQSPLLADHTHLSPDAIKTRLCHQIEADCAQRILPTCADEVIEQGVADAVDTMWAESRIKIYVPVLALRRARDEMHAMTPVAA